MSHRYAIYYAAAPASPLERFGMAWLGRDHRTGAPLAQPAVPGIAPDHLWALTAAPRRYGFHGTLKAPFRLAPGTDGTALHAAAAAFAASRTSFSLPPLVIADLEGFLAFVPPAPEAPLDRLAAGCVVGFESFRAPASAAELARRRQGRLSPRQDDHLVRFGYPYVFEDFRFHMTLTDRLAEADKAILLPHLEEIGRPLAEVPFVVDAIAVYEQPAPDADFIMTGHYPFAV